MACRRDQRVVDLEDKSLVSIILLILFIVFFILPVVVFEKACKFFRNLFSHPWTEV